MRIALVVIIGLLVISLGTVVAEPDPAEPEAPTVTEAARSEARTDTLSLKKQVRSLASATPAGELDDALAETANLLDHQAELLTAPQPTGREASPSPSPGASATAAEAEPTAAVVLSTLTVSGYESLRDAHNVEPGIARLLAVVGTRKLAAATTLAGAAGLPAPDIPHTPTRNDPAALISCPDTSAAPTAGTDNAGTDNAGSTQAVGLAALRAALAGLQRAVYAYEVATPKLPDPASSTAEDRLRRQKATLESGEHLLAANCGELPPAEPAYDVGGALRKNPGPALAMVESDLARMYADVVGMSEGEIRGWAIIQLSGSVLSAENWRR